MRAAFFSAVNEVRFIHTDEPFVQNPDDVKIHIKATGICASDISGLRGTHPTRKPPVISGHESSGVVTDVGSSVTDFKPGDRVAIEPHYGCMKCPTCLSGRYNACPDKKVLGTVKWSGSFAEYIIAPARTLIKLPDNISFEEGAVLEPFAVGIHAVRISELSIGKTAVVIGPGPIGLSCVLAAKLTGANKVIVVGVSDYSLQIAKEMGADVTINSSCENSTDLVLKETGGQGADTIFMAVSTNTVINDAISMARCGAQIMEVAHFGGKVPEFDTTKFRWKELSMKGTYMYTKQDYEIAVQAISSGAVNVRPMITKIAPIEDCVNIFQIAKTRSEKNSKIILSF